MIHRDAVNILAWLLALAGVIYALNAVKRFARGSFGEAMARAWSRGFFPPFSAEAR